MVIVLAISPEYILYLFFFQCYFIYYTKYCIVSRLIFIISIIKMIEGENVFDDRKSNVILIPIYICINENGYIFYGKRLIYRQTCFGS